MHHYLFIVFRNYKNVFQTTKLNFCAISARAIQKCYRFVYLYRKQKLANDLSIAVPPEGL